MTMALSRAMSTPSLAAELIDAIARRTAHGIADRAVGLVPRSGLRANALHWPIRPLLRGNPDIATAMYRGQFPLAGVVVDAGSRVIFEAISQNPEFATALHGFDWLKHLEAAGRELSRIQARSLITDWVDGGRYRLAVAREPEVASRRLISWIRHGGFILHNADAAFTKLYFTSVSRQASQLARAIHFAPCSRGRLDATIALGYAATALGGFDKARTDLLERLAEELDEQILPDGGHISRNPAATVELLLDLMPLRDALYNRSIHPPARFNAAVERMLPFLRFLLHGDGGIATFNGVSDTMAGAARAIIDADDVRGKPITLARHTGYARLAFGRSTVLVDVGKPPAAGLNRNMQSGPLAFEFSDGPHRVVVNCGSPQAGNGHWTSAARKTAAHSTAALGDRSASIILDNSVTSRVFGSPLFFGPQRVYGELTAHETGSVLEAYHDGYLASCGYLHERRMFLAKHGADLRGEDRFLAAPDGRTTEPETIFSIRFHLHPSIKCIGARDRASIILALPNRTGWKFSAKGAEMGIEDSVYLSGYATPRRSRQIVLTGEVGSARAVKWAFKRIEKAAMAPEFEREPQLPL
ncbi:putative heparinase superfamily protein [Rhodoligotrophos appendicifer]|uniref:heparinase II/III family protein n=1 Tax=Rhodoligotrophos appendicifer TaxID=987056 RepID=UPI00118523C7|nr:heparinase II/III family protein [Rhodoligotrophos appendicifer]